MVSVGGVDGVASGVDPPVRLSTTFCTASVTIFTTFSIAPVTVSIMDGVEVDDVSSVDVEMSGVDELVDSVDVEASGVVEVAGAGVGVSTTGVLTDSVVVAVVSEVEVLLFLSTVSIVSAVVEAVNVDSVDVSLSSGVEEDEVKETILFMKYLLPLVSP